MVAEANRKIHNIENVVFSNSLLTIDSFKGMPKFDLVVFLSVFHHIVRYNGLDYAKQYIGAISQINTKYLIFETGQPNEANMSWAHEMDFMLPDITQWVTDLLHSAGYTEVKIIGQHKAVRSEVPRLLFLAQK